MQPRRRSRLPLLAPTALLAILLASTLGAPGALAQAPPAGTTQVIMSVGIGDPGGSLLPERPYSLAVTVRYQYGNGGVTGKGAVDRLPIEAPDPGDTPCADVTILESPTWATASISEPRVCFPIPPNNIVGGTTVTNTTFLELNVTPGAPALEPSLVVVQAHAPPQGVFAEAQASDNRTVMPSYVGTLAMDAPATYTLRGGVSEQVPITVRNTGNGPIEVRFRNFSAPQGVRVELPERFALPVGDERVAYVTLVAPWTTPVVGQVQVAADSAHPERPDLVGDEPRVTFDVQGQAAVPAPASGLLLLALMGAALLAGRRRSRPRA